MDMLETLFLFGFAAGYLVFGLVLLVRGFIAPLRIGRGPLNPPVMARTWKRSWMNSHSVGSAPRPTRMQVSDSFVIKADAA